MSKKYDIIADWNLNEYCNFKCPYCYLSPEARKNYSHRGIEDIDEIVPSFDKTGVTWLVHMTGGEPFLHPDFIKLCQGLTKAHYISINTNLSLPNSMIENFSKEINPQKVEFIHCSLHITQRKSKKDIKLFIDNVHTLKKYGFGVYVSQVMWPPIIKHYDRLFSYFKEKGIFVRPKILKRLYKARQYPESYSQKEKEKILYFMDKAKEDRDAERLKTHIDTNIDKKWINGYVSFKGLPCAAGKSFVAIGYDGTVQRCNSDDTYLGNIYKGELRLSNCEEPCKADICLCPYYGFKFATGEPKTVKINSAVVNKPKIEDGLPPLYIYIPKEEYLDEYNTVTLEKYWSQLKIKRGRFDWTLLPYLHLKERNFPCKLTYDLQVKGIIFTHYDFLPWNIIPQAKQLLVCAKSDRTKHRFAQLHITQNPLDNLAVWWQRFLWPKHYLVNWPQPGLIIRSKERGDKFENIAYIGNKNQLADFLKKPAWTGKVHSLSLKWYTIFDKEKWNDYSYIDAIVAVRAFDAKNKYINKVASKLRNAWKAGVPAILGPESAYRAERKSKFDYIEANSTEEVLSALQLLRDDKQLRNKMITNGYLRAQELTPERICEQWENFFINIASPMYKKWCRLSRFEKKTFIILRKISVNLTFLYSWARNILLSVRKCGII